MGEKKRRRDAEVTAKGRVASPGRVGGLRLTWRGVGLFLGAMALLDILLYAVFRFGFDTCYAVLCLLE